MTTIQDFWFANKRFWFPVTAGEKAEADFEIAKQFWNYNLTNESLLGQIIYYDQFARHFQRAGLLTHVGEWREHAVILAEEADLADENDERVIVWTLMPYKHVGMLDQALERTAPFLREDRPLLRKFFEDTYKKSYTQEWVRWGIKWKALPSVRFNAADICEEVGILRLPDEIDDPINIPLARIAASSVCNGERVVVSLSGGIDSMLLCYLYAALGYNVTAVHIIYGNRAESEEEYSFVADFCQRIAVPLAVYRIPWIRRNNVSREFYEKMTRDIRFMVYRSVADGAIVILGHIYDDIVENIMTNFVRGDHLDWLGAMTTYDTQMGVRLVRPLLNVKKAKIYAVARLMGLSWLKNTTPSWSNRGKFREKFHSALVDQYGPSVDDALVAVAQRIQSQAAILDRLLYEPIKRSWVAEKMELDVSVAVQAQLDPAGWMRIFEFVCHERLGVKKPTLAAAGEFIRRVKRLYSDGKIKINMGKGLVFFVKRTGECFKMAVELS